MQLQYVTGAAVLVDLDQRAASPGRGEGKQLAAGAERPYSRSYPYPRVLGRQSCTRRTVETARRQPHAVSGSDPRANIAAGMSASGLSRGPDSDLRRCPLSQGC